MVSSETILHKEKPLPIKDILSELTHIMSRGTTLWYCLEHNVLIM